VADLLKRLSDSGKIVITVDSDVAYEAADVRRAYIGTNNREAGKVAGQVAAQIRPQGGKVAVFVGIPSAANAIERREGFFEGAGSKFVEQEVFSDKVEMKVALDNVQIATSKYPDLGLLLGLWSYNAPAIGDFVASAPALRRQVNVVTFDLDENAIPHVESGRIDATVCQNPYMMGYLGVRLLKALVEKDQETIDEMLPGGATVIDTGVRVVVPNAGSPVTGVDVMTVDEMKKWLASKGLKST
jgi:ribose transport system substrate-binding protein